MKTFIAEEMEISEVELVANGYPVTQQGAGQYAIKLWALCSGPAAARKRRAKAAYGANYGRKYSQPC